jgi:hypothetical protein
MRKVALVMAMVLAMAVGAWAGDKEDLQGKLEKIIQQKTISSLTLENIQLKAPGFLQAKAADDKVAEQVNALVKEIGEKGFVIQQGQDGQFKVQTKPEVKKNEDKK